MSPPPARKLGSTLQMLGVGRNGPALLALMVDESLISYLMQVRDAMGAMAGVWNGKLVEEEPDGGWYGAPPGG